MDRRGNRKVKKGFGLCGTLLCVAFWAGCGSMRSAPQNVESVDSPARSEADAGQDDSVQIAAFNPYCAAQAAKIARFFRISDQLVSAAVETDWVTGQFSPYRYEISVDEFLTDISWRLYGSGDRYEIALNAAGELLDMDGELYFGGFTEEEVQVFKDWAYDADGREYRTYTFFLPDATEPAARVYISEELFLYACDGTRYWSSDSLAAQMPQLHSGVEEGKRWVAEYLDAVCRESSYEIVYKGSERRDDLEPYMEVYHYSVRERNADNTETVWDAYVGRRLTHPSKAFYVELSDNCYEKRRLCEWTSGEGHTYLYAFSRRFHLEEGEICFDGDTEATIFKDGVNQGHFSYALSDWERTEGYWEVDDYTFDDIPDIAVTTGAVTNWGGEGANVYVGDGQWGYHHGGYYDDIPVADYPTQTLRVNARQGNGYYVYFAYCYRDGGFAVTAVLEEEYLDDGISVVASGSVYTLTDEDGNVETYEDELPKKWAEFWGK